MFAVKARANISGAPLKSRLVALPTKRVSGLIHLFSAVVSKIVYILRRDKLTPLFANCAPCQKEFFGAMTLVRMTHDI
jgi:hypothetical protein